jgi:parallel beta-helix repeat protein
VYNNSGAARGIAFSINTTNSVAKNNFVHDQPRCISFNRESNHNEVYNNTLSNCKMGVFLSDTGNNSIHNNRITNSQNGVVLYNISNNIYDNEISQTKYGILFELQISNETSKFEVVSNRDIDAVNYETYLADMVDRNKIDFVEEQYKYKEKIVESLVEDE